MSRYPAPAARHWSDYYRDSVYASSPQVHRRVGSLGISLIDVRQRAVETVDPALPELAIVSVLAGGPGEIDTGDGWRRVHGRRGLVDVQPAGVEWALRLPDTHLRTVCVPVATLRRLLDEHGAGAAALDAVSGAFRTLPAAADAVDRMWAASASAGPATGLQVDGAFLVLLGTLLRAARGRDSGACAAVRGGARPALRGARLARATERLEAGEPALAELADDAGLPRAAFGEAFERATGEPAWAYARRRGCERARALLADASLPLAEVARRTGFAHANELRHAFRARYGAFPDADRAEPAG